MFRRKRRFIVLFMLGTSLATVQLTLAQWTHLYHSKNLTNYLSSAECNPGEVTSCPCTTNDVSYHSSDEYGIVTSNPQLNNTYVNAIAGAKFYDTFTNGSPVTLGIYRYSYDVRLPMMPAPDLNQTNNPEGVHLMMQLWDGAGVLWSNDHLALEGALLWTLNPWSTNAGKLWVYSTNYHMVETGITLPADTQWHTFELILNLTTRQYISATVDGLHADLHDIPFLVKHYPAWDTNSLALLITCESMATFPGQECGSVFTWSTCFRNINLYKAENSIQLYLEPTNACAAGAQWRVDEGAWMNRGETVFPTVGTHTTEYRNVQGWIEPDSQPMIITNAQHTILTNQYEAMSGTWSSASFKAFALTNSITLRWPDPRRYGISNNYVHIRSQTSTYPIQISDGIPVYTGRDTKYQHSNLTPQQTYYYTIWVSHDGTNFISPQ